MTRALAAMVALIGTANLSASTKRTSHRQDVIRTGARRARLRHWVQTAIWGHPFVDNVHTLYAGLKAAAVGLNYFRKFPNLKTAADKFVNTANNVSIDAYATADLAAEPVVVRVPPIKADRWTIVQIGDFYDQVVYNIAGSKGPEPGLFLVTGPDYHGQIPAGTKQIKVRTQLGVIANRVFVNGENDLPAAREVQKGFQALPLSMFQKQGLRFEIPKQYDYARFEFKPTAPEAFGNLSGSTTYIRFLIQTHQLVELDFPIREIFSCSPSRIKLLPALFPIILSPSLAPFSARSNKMATMAAALS